MTLMHRRAVLVPLLAWGLGWSYQRSVAERNVGPVVAVVTEDGQQVVFQPIPWQYRELAKLLPLDQPWPAHGAEMQKILARYGLDRGAPKMTMPARILTDIYLVGQEHINNNLTYLIDCGREGVAIIDPSFESEFDKTLARIEQCGYSPKQVRWVINTHCHTDHAMSDAKWRQMGAQIMIQEADAEAVEKATRVTGYYREREAKKPPENRHVFPPCKVDHRLSDGEELQLGNKLLQVIHTPGHTPGSACFLLQIDGKNVLFSGDTVFYDGMLGAQRNPYADNRQLLASLEKLQRFAELGVVRWDVLLPGHGAIAMDKAYLDIQKDRDYLVTDVAANRDPSVSPHGRPEYRARMFGRPPVKISPQP